jgi:hypothetical protein
VLANSKEPVTGEHKYTHKTIYVRKGHKKTNTKDSKDKIHEMQSSIQFIGP